MKRAAPPCPRAPQRQRGVSLIELMVGLVVALVISLVMFNVFIVAEGQRRTTASGSDAQQSGAFTTYSLERQLRMGGAGIGRAGFSYNLWGCHLQITSRSPTTEVRVPLPTSLPAPFNSLGLTDLRTAPALIINGGSKDDNNATSAASDALMVMAGTHRAINTWIEMAGTAGTSQVSVVNSLGIQRNDLLLAVERDKFKPNALNKECQLVQATSDPVLSPKTAANYLQSADNNGKTITIAVNNPTYTPTNGLVTAYGAYSSSAVMANLGASPLLAIYAVTRTSGPGRELRSYNMLTGEVQSLTDGVVNLQAVYGVSNTFDGEAVDSWQSPVGDWNAATLMDGSDVSLNRLQRLRAIRLSIVTRSALMEREAVTTKTSVLTGDSNFTYDLNWTGDDRKFRYRQFEIIVPLRNMLLAPNDPLK